MLSFRIARTMKQRRSCHAGSSSTALRVATMSTSSSSRVVVVPAAGLRRRWNTNTACTAATTTTAVSLPSFSWSSNNTNGGDLSSSRGQRQLLNTITARTISTGTEWKQPHGLLRRDKVEPFLYDVSQTARLRLSSSSSSSLPALQQSVAVFSASHLPLVRWSPQQQYLQCRFSSSSSSSPSSSGAPSGASITAASPTPPASSTSTPASASSSKRTTTTTNTTTTISRSTIPTPSSAPPINSLKDKVPKPMAVLKQFSDWTIYLGRTIVLGLFVRLPKALYYYLRNPAEVKSQYQRLKQLAKDEMNHYWVGTKLLVADVRTARDLTRKTLHGNALTRRERSQLLRTVADLFRLIPFSMFILIPLAEFALPLALKIFPNLLPSTFQDSLKAEETMKRELQSRLAMAQFFQETLEELAKEQKRKARKARKANSDATTTTDTTSSSSSSSTDSSSSSSSLLHLQEDSAASMLEFLQKARNGEMLESSVIIRYAKYFQDDLTLDNMPRMQLMNMCKYMNIAPYGNDSFLRFQLRHRIRILKEDDQRILWEGIESLTKMELREACQERGMRSTGLSKEAYKYALQQWLDLSVQKNVPISLLIMSRSFFLREDMFHPPDSSTSTVSGAAASTATAATISMEAAAASPAAAKAALERGSITPTTNEFITTTASSSADPDKLTSSTTFADASATKVPAASPPPSTKLDLDKSSVAGIADAISGLDNDILSSVILEVATEKEKLTDPEIRKLKLQVLSQQNELIKQEKADQEQANLAKKKEKEQQVIMAAAAAATTAGSEYTLEQQQQPPSPSLSTDAGISSAEVKDASSPPSFTTTTTPSTPEAVEKEVEEDGDEPMDLSTNEMDALRALVSDDPVSSERAQLQQIKAAMTKSDHRDEDEEEESVMGGSAQEMTASTMGQDERVVTSATQPAMTPEETDRMVTETIEKLDSTAAASDSTTFSTTMTTQSIETASQSTSSKTTDVVEDDDKYLEEEMIPEDPIVARLKKRIESMLEKIEVQLSDVHSKIGDKLHMLDKDKDGILSQEEVAGVLQQVLKREITLEEAKEIAGEMDENSDGVLTVEELMRWIDEHKLVKFVEEGRDADMDRVMEEVQTPSSSTVEKDVNSGTNSNGKQDKGQ